ncbi:MAG: pyridine nucleotide-disulfide oxidoreductase, partial [Cellulomonas sp.]|nr:pyridine nucleotide-disulfide oxidoreductase [Cellulomonas sp.]
HDWPVEAVYRAIGYFGSPLAEVPFDEAGGVIANREGRVVDETGAPVPGLYATGWIKRGPVGLIGHTKSDAQETIRHLVADAPTLPQAPIRDPQAVLTLLAERKVDVVPWSGWELLDAHEQDLGAAQGRTRVKVVPREQMVDVSLRRTQG